MASERHLYEDIDWLNPKERENAQKSLGMELFLRENRRFAFFEPFFRALLKESHDKVRKLTGIDYSTISRWASGEREPDLYRPEDIEITPGRMYLLGESASRSFYCVRGHRWMKNGDDIFTAYIYPQLVQLAGILPRHERMCRTQLTPGTNSLLATPVGGIKQAFLKALDKKGLAERQGSGSYRIAFVPENGKEPAYFQGLFDRHGFAGLQHGTPHLHFSAGNGWEGFLEMFSLGRFPAAVTKVEYKSAKGSRLDMLQRRRIKEHFPLSELETSEYNGRKISVMFSLFPLYLGSWMGRQRDSGKVPDAHKAAKSMLFLGKSASYSSSPRKANGIAASLEKMASRGYGARRGGLENRFRTEVGWLLRKMGGAEMAEEVRGRYPENSRGYSLFVYPKWVEEAGITKQECRSYIGELSACSQLNISESYGGRKRLTEVLVSGTVPYDFRL
ncbi:MAG: hypothetical protein HYX24_02425 [Candidatus Aenigmarchaeota archaeon]|nr:hypothetical protein [Candidatus Aenigmarchaeota archaeon]